MPFSDEVLVRFWAKVDVRGPDECWPCAEGMDPHGYGKFKLNGRDRGAHRIACEIVLGDLGDNQVAMHRCDNPPCCNPRHLRSGTHAQNNADKIVKRRTGKAPRAANGRAKLTDEAVAFIRSSGRRGIDLAREFGVATSTITFIRRGPTASYNRAKRERLAAVMETMEGQAA